MSDVASSLYDFGLSLYKNLAKENAEQNIFFSPLSIYTALLMVYRGSDNETAREMRVVMRNSYLPKDEEMLKWVEQVCCLSYTKFWFLGLCLAGRVI